MGVLRQLLLILWKGGLMRKRHYFMTFLETFIPLLLVFVLVYFRSYIGDLKRFGSGTEVKWKEATVFDPENVLSDSYKPNNYKYNILYSPPTTLSLDVVKETVARFGHLETRFNYTGLDNEDKMFSYFLRNSAQGYSGATYVGVIFNHPMTELPDSLNYKLRLRREYMTNMKYSYMANNGPRLGYDNYKDFMGWQAAIDQTFIKMTEEKMNLEPTVDKTTVYSQRFPYPAYVESNSLLTMIMMIDYVIVYGLSFMMPFFVKRIIDEKVNRAKELMKMMGLTDFVYFVGTFSNTFIVAFGIAVITSILFKIRFVSGAAVLDYSDGSLFFVALVLYMINGLIFCMAISAFFNKAVLGAIITYLVWNMSHSIPVNILDPIASSKYGQLSLSSKLGTCLLPNCAFHWVCKVFSMFEGSETGASWSALYQPGVPEDDLTLGMVLGMMLVSIAMYSFIFWYVDSVWPWQIGIPKSPGFLFMPSFWCPKATVMEVSADDELSLNKQHFEAISADQEPGIVLQGLSKEFGWGSARKLAVDRVSLTMLKGHITVLLGHNGAGKTTAMNVLTGIYKPSAGAAKINGYDIVSNTREARNSLGLCPQHNVLYDSLTTEEHLKFFAGLKGMKFSDMPAEVTSVLKLLDLEAKRTTRSSALSGGMKRKLSLGIALVANSKVLILDEPTSGMDPQARRTIWDLLQRIRQERTVLLTTHYMEEADVLADRIAIMAEGRIQCCGSPFFLKKAFGAGYHLRISKGNSFNYEHLKEILQKYVPDMYVDSDSPTEVVFVLPVADTTTFVPLFDELEANKSQTGYNSCGVSITTMEDVFLKVGHLATANELAKTKTEVIEIEEDRNGFSNQEQTTRVRGYQLYRQIATGLMLKRFHDAKRYWAFLLFQVILPCLMISIMLVITNLINSSLIPKSDPLTLNVGKVFGTTIGVCSKGTDSFTQNLTQTLSDYGVSVEQVDDPLQTVLNVGGDNLNTYKYKYLVGGAVNSSQSELGSTRNLWALYNGEPFHTKAMSLNLMDTAWLRATTKKDFTITTTNHPFPYADSIFSNNPLMTLPNRLIFAIFLPSAISFLSASFVLFPIHERVTKSKLIQQMTGLPGVIFWGCHFLWDFMMVVVASCLMLIPFVAAAGSIYGHNDGILGVVFLMLLCYGWSAIPFTYILSFIGKKPSSGFIIASSISSITGMMTNLGIGIYRSIEMSNMLGPNKDQSFKADSLAWIFRLFPDFSLTWGISNLHFIGQYNSFCQNVDPRILEALCPIIHNITDSNSATAYLPCCPAEICGEDCFKRKEYITFNADSCGRDFLFLILTGFMFFGLLVVLETNFVRFWYSLKKYIKERKNGQQDNIRLLDFQNGSVPSMAVSEDEDVAQERAFVEGCVSQNDTSSNALLVHNLTKHFASLCAVDHLSFTVKHKECFGLLGVNGAGKTTTFSMLTGDLIVDGGNGFINRVNLKDNLQQFQGFIGYCPQFDALLDRMTGREALSLFARLRGIPEREISYVVSEMISMMDLDKHADKIAEKYSGGTRRKLSLGVSLIGSPQIVFLDEPTAGVDPASRRKIWKALLKVQKSGTSSFILTTHSMEECEALSGRLAIMVNGQFRCLGPIQHLKTKYGQGYTILLKLQKSMTMWAPQQEEAAIQVIRDYMEKNFINLELKDFHQGMLHYHLTDPTIQWSHLFREMEKIKKIYNLEDYFVSDTTLEQIFLAFARTQRIVAA